MQVDVLINVADGLIYNGLDYADRIERRLAQARLTSARYNLTEPDDHSLRPALAHVFTGGQTSVHAPVAWMRAAVDRIRSLIADARKDGPAVVGVCLGSQLIAEALRPGSIIGTSGIEVGLTPVARVRDDGASDERGVEVVPSFHYQAIDPQIREVKGVRIEYRNEHTPVQALSYGERVFGCQFHPELRAADVQRLIDYSADLIAERNGDTTVAHRSVEQHWDALRDDLFDRMVTDRIRG